MIMDQEWEALEWVDHTEDLAWEALEWADTTDTEAEAPGDHLPHPEEEAADAA